MVERGELSPKLKPFPDVFDLQPPAVCERAWTRARLAPETADPAEMTASSAGEKLIAPMAARAGSANGIRKIIRGAIGIATVLVIWQVMSVAYDLQQILPPPLAVARTIFNTLTLNYEHRWLYGPNIYEHLLSSFARAITGFAIAAASAIPLGLLVGRFRAVREFVDPVIRSLYPIPGIAWIPLAILWFGLGNTAVDLRGVHRRVLSALFQYRSWRTQHQPDPGRCRALLRRQASDAAAPRHPAGIDPLHHHRHADRARRRLAHDRGRRDAGIAVRHRFGA